MTPPNELLIETIQKALEKRKKFMEPGLDEQRLRALLEALEYNKKMYDQVHDSRDGIEKELRRLEAERDELATDSEWWQTYAEGWKDNTLYWKNVYRQTMDELAAKDRVFDFAKEIIQIAFAGGDADGGHIQELGIKHGLLVEDVYDPERHGEADYAEPGDRWYVFSPTLSSYPSREKGATE